MMANRFIAMIILALLWSIVHCGANVAVRFKEGLTHGFLVLSTLDGTPIAYGDLNQTAHDNQVTSNLIYHFKDGSLQEELTVFSQRKSFSLISYRLIQKGPTFQHPLDMLVNTATGIITVRYSDDKGQEKTESEHLKKVPPDLANGLVLTILKNLRPDGVLPQLSMVVATPKPRIIKLALSVQGKEPFTLAGSDREALNYDIKIEIGGVEGFVAPLLGMQPPDAHVWILGGEAPAFVKSESVSFLGGPMWRTELVAPVWPRSDSAESKSSAEEKH